ncbi:MAG: DUF6122 family protein [Thermodesulfobacteriota bacterium]
MMIRPIVHLLLHLIVPAAAARWVYSEKWKTAWLLMVATMLVDLDHLLADPIYDPDRCGIGFHPLHAYAAMPVYAVLAVIPGTRLVGLGLLIHMALDELDCIWMGLI